MVERLLVIHDSIFSLRWTATKRVAICLGRRAMVQWSIDNKFRQHGIRIVWHNDCVTQQLCDTTTVWSKDCVTQQLLNSFIIPHYSNCLLTFIDLRQAVFRHAGAFVRNFGISWFCVGPFLHIFFSLNSLSWHTEPIKLYWGFFCGLPY